MVRGSSQNREISKEYLCIYLINNYFIPVRGTLSVILIYNLTFTVSNLLLAQGFINLDLHLDFE